MALDHETFRPIEGDAATRQSVGIILSTPIGTRVMRRDFGSRLFDLLDEPATRQTILAIYGASAEAIARWEDRIEPTWIRAAEFSPGRVVLNVEARRRSDNGLILLNGIEVR